MILPLLLALSGYHIILATSPVCSVLPDSTRKKKFNAFGFRKLWSHRRRFGRICRVRCILKGAWKFLLMGWCDVSLTNYLLLISLAFLVLGFAAINRFGMSTLIIWSSMLSFSSLTAPDATQFGEHTVTQKHLYTGLFVIGIPLLWLSSPISTIFWLIGASGVLILGHASVIEPGVESEYANIQESV